MIKTAPQISFLAVVATVGLLFAIPSFANEVQQDNPQKQSPEEVLLTDAEYDLNQVLITYTDAPEKISAELIDGDIPSDDPITSDVLESNNPERVVGLTKRDQLRSRMEELRNDPNVLNYQPSYIYKNDVWGSSGGKDTPNDFDLTPSAETGNHWYYEKSRLRELWNDQDCAGAGEDCGGSDAVTVAVIDTGLAFEDHTSAWIDEGAPFDYDPLTEMFGGTSINLYTNSSETEGDTVDNDVNGFRDDYHGVDTANWVKCEVHGQCSTNAQRAETGHPNDDGGHGTYVAGMITSLVDNGTGSVGAAHNVTLMPVKANYQTINGFGTLELYYAIYYATDHGADIINMSLSGSSPDSVLKAAIDYAVANDVLVIGSTGNSGGSVQYPANYSNVVAVGALNSDDSRSSYSSYGGQIDLAAYVGDSTSGESTYQLSYDCFGLGGSSGCYEDSDSDSIYSLSPTRYKSFSAKGGRGTSFAAPQVAAWAALIKSHQPTLTDDEIKQYMYDHAIDVGASGWDNQSGWGAVDYATGLNEAPSITIVEPNSAEESADVTFNITWTDNDEDDDAKVTLYTDTNASGQDGLVIGSCQNISEDSVTDSCTADVRHLPAGVYYVYGCIDDPYHDPVCDYSTGTLDVAHTPASESGKASVNHEWKSITFDTPFSAPPVVVANVVSNYGSDMVYTNIKNVTTTGFEIQLQENTAQGRYNGLHAFEVVNWYATLSTGATETAGVFGLNSASTSSDWETIGFSSTFGAIPKVFANVQTENGSHMAYVDIKDVSTNSFKAKLTEPPGWDGAHAQELIGYIAFVDLASAQENTASIDSSWTTITYPTPYSEPPVVISEVSSEVGTDQALVEIKDVTATNFQARIEEDPRFLNGVHYFETISWMSLTATHPKFVSMNETIDSTWKEIAFDEILASTPNIFAEVLTENGPDIVEVDIKDITQAGMYIRVEEDRGAGWNGIHLGEEVSIRAQVSGINGGIEVGNDNVNNTWRQINYNGSYTTPMLFAEVQSENGPDTANVDIRRDGIDFYVRVEEDPSAGWDDIHKNEKVSWMIMESPVTGCYGTSSIEELGNFAFYPISFVDDSTGGDCNFTGTPYLSAEINTENGTQTVQVDMKDLTTSSVSIRLEEEITWTDRLHVVENVVWYAWE